MLARDPAYIARLTQDAKRADHCDHRVASLALFAQLVMTSELLHKLDSEQLRSLWSNGSIVMVAAGQPVAPVWAGPMLLLAGTLHVTSMDPASGASRLEIYSRGDVIEPSSIPRTITAESDARVFRMELPTDDEDLYCDVELDYE